ncbi:MAG: hypothetical protein HY007_03150 [Candidatus Sungbacteria bacterium]|nr:hypothetical protein [Candidatus Sungbacteria bacterium]
MLFITLIIFSPSISHAASFSYAVWIPYWRDDPGTAEVAPNLKAIQEISPFSYEVRADGTLADKLKIGLDPWPGFFAAAAGNKSMILPTVSWIDGDAILRTLASTTARTRHIAEIVDTVRTNNFAGIDIDYENKKAETRAYFSKFLKELSAKLRKDKKILSCSIESRTPVNSRFVVVPKDLKYANDFSAIGQYCDEVRILAYDQNNIDLKLNKQKGRSEPYAPVADIDWVKKVLQEALKSVSAKKIMLGIPTFGYEHAITPRLNGEWDYQKIRSVSYQKAMKLAQSASATPLRNRAGEMSFTYHVISSSTPLTASSTCLVWFPDAVSAQAKIKLAKQFKLRGIAVFKADGESDPTMWQVLK